MNLELYKQGQKIRNFRLRAKLSQLELENRIGASPGSISRIENGQINPTKETLRKISQQLKLSPLDESLIYNIKLVEFFNEIIQVPNQVLSKSTLEETLDLITKKLTNIIGVSISAVFLIDEQQKKLRLKSISIPKNVIKIVEKVMGRGILNFVLVLDSPENSDNLYVKSFVESEIIKTSKIYDLANPIVDKKTSDFLEKLIGMKLAISIPLVMNNKKIGILGLVWNSESVSEGEMMMINLFAQQISLALSQIL